MNRTARQLFTYQDYLQLEEDGNVKHEFLDGEAWAMAGGSPAHAALIYAVSGLLHAQLRGKSCRGFTTELRIRVEATGLGTYPDVVVVCGQLELDPADPKGHTATNPRVIVEVLSPSTAAFDRGEKLANYQQIPSLAEVVLVAHDVRSIEVVRRESNGTWSRQVATAGQNARLASIECELAVDEIYHDPLGPVA